MATKVDPDKFQQKFGAGIGQLEELVAEKTVTISRLMEIAPPGTIDPTPGVYNTVMYLMAFLLFLALISNALMRPVNAKHHMEEKNMKN